MREIIITQREAGQRLDHLLEKKLKNAQKSFIYKMMRKKNITLNGKKALGTERLCVQDSIRIYFSDETWIKFTGETIAEDSKHSSEDYSLKNRYPSKNLDILYEDDHILLINKPSGMLSQKASEKDISLCEYLIGYLLRDGQITPESLSMVKPSVCNRLDRNTSGIVLCGKTAAGLKELSELIRSRNIGKYYHCVVSGRIDKPAFLSGYLDKNEKTNEVRVSASAFPGGKEIKTEYYPVKVAVIVDRYGKSVECTLLKVHLITGRSHQIRSHLSSIGHPIIGDYKYGNEQINEFFRREKGIRSQMLHCSEVIFPRIYEETLIGISEKHITAPYPRAFRTVMGE